VQCLLVLVPSQAVHGNAIAERLGQVLGSAKHEGSVIDYDHVLKDHPC
jgi:hypothetical protein